jgi:hypothetical protein
MHWVRVFALQVVIAALAVPASGQDSREGSIIAEQAAKAQKVEPHKRHPAEELLLEVRQALIEQPSGFYPYFDSVYSGGGFTLGAGFRQYTGDRAHWNIAGLYSFKGYKLIRADAATPGLWSGRVDLRSTVGWRDATQVRYHGLGIDSPADMDTAFRMQQTFGGGDATAHLDRWLHLTAGASYEHYAIHDPTGDLPSVQDAFTADNAPGVGVDPSYIHSFASVAVDWRRPGADYARSGGLYQVTRHFWKDINNTYSFDRLDAEVVQHIPILRENWVVSLRGRLETTLDDTDQVPYFLLPSLGSGSTLRGYDSWRFRDRHGLMFSGEWRWIVSRLAFDMALFYDTGMVAPRFEQLARNGFVSNYGVGARFHGPTRTPLRIELAKGNEGVQLVFSASAAF